MGRHFSYLQILKLDSCPELEELPELPSSLIGLKWTDDIDKFYEGMLCAQRSGLPTNISPPLNLPRVESISTIHCRHLPFGVLFNARSSLRELELGNLTFRGWNSFNLENLSTLRLARCQMHEPVPEASSSRFGCVFPANVLDLSPMKNLQEVHLLGIVSLHMLCGLKDLRKLRKLRVGECQELLIVQGLNHLESLQKLWIHDCCLLESLGDTSDLHLECCTIERCKGLPNRNSYCRCHNNRDLVVTEFGHAGLF